MLVQMQSDQVVYGYYLKKLPVRYCGRAVVQTAVNDSSKKRCVQSRLTVTSVYVLKIHGSTPITFRVIKPKLKLSGETQI